MSLLPRTMDYNLQEIEKRGMKLKQLEEKECIINKMLTTYG